MLKQLLHSVTAILICTLSIAFVEDSGQKSTTERGGRPVKKHVQKDVSIAILEQGNAFLDGQSEGTHLPRNTGSVMRREHPAHYQHSGVELSELRAEQERRREQGTVATASRTHTKLCEDPSEVCQSYFSEEKTCETYNSELRGAPELVIEWFMKFWEDEDEYEESKRKKYAVLSCGDLSCKIYLNEQRNLVVYLEHADPQEQIFSSVVFEDKVKFHVALAFDGPSKKMKLYFKRASVDGAMTMSELPFHQHPLADGTPNLKISVGNNNVLGCLAGLTEEQKMHHEDFEEFEGEIEFFRARPTKWDNLEPLSDEGDDSSSDHEEGSHEEEEEPEEAEPGAEEEEKKTKEEREEAKAAKEEAKEEAKKEKEEAKAAEKEAKEEAKAEAKAAKEEAKKEAQEAKAEAKAAKQEAKEEEKAAKAEAKEAEKEAREEAKKAKDEAEEAEKEAKEEEEKVEHEAKEAKEAEEKTEEEEKAKEEEEEKKAKEEAEAKAKEEEEAKKKQEEEAKAKEEEEKKEEEEAKKEEEEKAEAKEEEEEKKRKEEEEEAKEKHEERDPEQQITIENWVSGWCSPWKWGASREFEAVSDDMNQKVARDTREGIAYFPGDWKIKGRQMRMKDCEEKCRADIACEEAVWRTTTGECFLGVETMASNAGNGKSAGFANSGDRAEEMCFAKKGFGFHSPRSGRLKLGYCGDENFKEGFEPGKSAECDTADRAPEEQLRCSHWPNTFKLSREGCWARCDGNPFCTQALHTKITTEDGEVKFECRIGTFKMSNAYFEGHADGWKSLCYYGQTTSCEKEDDAMYVKSEQD